MQSFNNELSKDRIDFFPQEGYKLLEEDDIPFDDEGFVEESEEFDEVPSDDDLAFEDLSQKDSQPYNLNHIGRKIRILEFSRTTTPEKHRTLLWPVYLWRVAAPTPTESQVNFLELTCIRLAEAGVRTISEQARYLALSKELIDNVLNHAVSEGYLNGTYKLTEAGKEILESEGIENRLNTQYGWILQEAVSGDILPFFHIGKLDTLNPSKEAKSGLVIPTLLNYCNPPKESLASQAIQTYYKLKELAKSPQNDSLEIQYLKYCSTEESANDDKFDTVGFLIEEEKSPINLDTPQSVRILSNKPTKYHLAVHTLVDGSAEGSFSLMCPFGLPDGMRWMRLFHFSAKQNEEVGETMKYLQNHSRELWKQKQPPELEPTELEREANSRLRFEIGNSLNGDYQTTWIELVNMMQAKILLERGFDQADTTITRAQRALEQLIITFIKSEPVPEEVVSLYKEKQTLSKCIRDTVEGCGVISVPDWLTNLNNWQLKTILKYPRSSLLAYVSTLFFIASRKGKAWIRFKAVLSENPDFLNEMYRVAKARNEFGAHARGINKINDAYVIKKVEESVVVTCKNIKLLTKNRLD